MPDVSEGGRRVRKEHHAEAREGRVPAAGKGRDLGVRLPELQAFGAGRFRPAPGDLQHGRRDVEPQHLALGADPPGELQAGVSAAAANVEHGLAGRRRQPVHRRQAEGADLPVDPVLQGRPCPSRHVVPVGLLGLVGGRHRHPPACSRLVRAAVGP